MRPHATPTLLAAGLLLAACGPAAPRVEPTPAASEVAVDGSASPVEASPTDAPAVPSTLADPAFGLAGVALTTPAQGGGPHPVLAWEAVPGAADYSVVVLAPDGRPYWAWRGEATGIPVGGLPQLADHAAGPRVIPGMRWVVTAWDVDGHAVAISDLRPIAP